MNYLRLLLIRTTFTRKIDVGKFSGYEFKIVIIQNVCEFSIVDIRYPLSESLDLGTFSTCPKRALILSRIIFLIVDCCLAGIGVDQSVFK